MDIPNASRCVLHCLRLTSQDLIQNDVPISLSMTYHQCIAAYAIFVHVLPLDLCGQSPRAVQFPPPRVEFRTSIFFQPQTTPFEDCVSREINSLSSIC